MEDFSTSVALKVNDELPPIFFKSISRPHPAEANASKVVMLCISEIGNPRQWRLYNSQLWMNMICLASSLMMGSITSISSKG